MCMKLCKLLQESIFYRARLNYKSDYPNNDVLCSQMCKITLDVEFEI